VAFAETLVRPQTNRVGWGEPGAYWTGSNYGGTRFTTFEGPNTSVPDQFHTCNAHDYIYAPCISTGAGSNIGHYARSLHTGGVQVGLCDGSIRFVSNTVDLVVWRSVGSRAGGEVVGGDW
jgi:hypothetical protein